MRKITILGLVLGLVISLLGQSGELDLLFSPYDEGVGNYDGLNNYINSCAVQSDDKIVIGGGFDQFTGEDDNAIDVNHLIRLNSDGTFDSTFNIDTSFYSLSSFYDSNYYDFLEWKWSRIYGVEILSNDKILISGVPEDAYYLDGITIVRLNPDGTRDKTFNPQNVGYETRLGAEMLVLSNGKVLVCVAEKDLYLLNHDGSLDESFDIGEGFDNGIWAEKLISIVELEDSSILIAGSFDDFNGVEVNNLVRISNKGRYIQNYNHLSINEMHDSYLRNVLRDLKNGYFTIAGRAIADNYGHRGLHKISYDGIIDTSFKYISSGGELINYIIQSNGDIISVNKEESSIYQLLKLKDNGIIDSIFYTGIGSNGYISEILFQSNGYIIIAGSFTKYNNNGKNRICRLINDTSSISNQVIKIDNSQPYFYPNPADHKIMLQMESNDYSYLIIRNISGQIVMQEQINNTQMQLDVSALESGLYLIELQGKGKSITEKIIIR
jgi:uncharacterized delta-60 repeat protein